MRTDYRLCGGSAAGFNTGQNFCPLQPGKAKAVILTYHGKKLPKELTAESLEKACHADGQDRIFPILGISEYATSGGEASTSENGYAGTNITGYSARTDTFTLTKYNMALQANLVSNKSTTFDMYVVDENDVIYGIDDASDSLAGIPLTGVYPTGQPFSSSGQVAYLAFNALYADIESYMKNASAKGVTFNVVGALTGLVFAEFIEIQDGKYKLVDHYDRTDLTSYYGALIAQNAATALVEGTSASYSDGILTISGEPKLASPSVLHELGIIGVEQW
jgi:hypothetical protein